MKYEPLATRENELDYGPKGGPIPAFWWLASMSKEKPIRKLDWFRRRELHMVQSRQLEVRHRARSRRQEGHGGRRGRKGQADHVLSRRSTRRVPTRCFFWTGGERELVGEVECNLAPTIDVGNVYYRSCRELARRDRRREPSCLYDDKREWQPVRCRSERASLPRAHARRRRWRGHGCARCSTRCESARGRACRTPSSCT
jgi:hypothetical protein